MKHTYFKKVLEIDIKYSISFFYFTLIINNLKLFGLNFFHL